MSFAITREGEITVVKVEGELTVSNRQHFKEGVLGRLEGGDRAFLVDFGAANYIDSSGLGALVSISKKIRERDGELRLAGLDEDLRTLFELTRLDTLFHIAENRAAALGEF